MPCTSAYSSDDSSVPYALSVCHDLSPGGGSWGVSELDREDPCDWLGGNRFALVWLIGSGAYLLVTFLLCQSGNPMLLVASTYDWAPVLPDHSLLSFLRFIWTWLYSKAGFLWTCCFFRMSHEMYALGASQISTPALDHLGWDDCAVNTFPPWSLSSIGDHCLASCVQISHSIRLLCWESHPVGVHRIHQNMGWWVGLYRFKQ